MTKHEIKRKEWYFLIGLGMIFALFAFILGIGGTGYGFLDLTVIAVLLFGGLILIGKS